MACEWDPLRDDCFDYADCLRTAGITAQVRHEPELVHACLRARHTSRAAEAMFRAIVGSHFGDVAMTTIINQFPRAVREIENQWITHV